MNTLEIAGELDRLLIIAAEDLDIPPGKLEDAKKKYEAIGNWLDAEDSPLRPFHPRLFAQGSVAHGTATKPIGSDEHDVDLTCEIQFPAWMTPAAARDMVLQRISSNEIYRDKIDNSKRRCIRIRYAGDFHLDVIPCKPDPLARGIQITDEAWAHGGTAVLIPDKELANWSSSDPAGYTGWFLHRAKLSRLIVATNERSTEFSVAASLEPFPQHDPANKLPLQVLVQIMKRHRDCYFQGRDDAPISIIISTLGARAIRPANSLVGAFAELPDRMELYIDGGPGSWSIPNPTNYKENFADRWNTHPERATAFEHWRRQLKADVDALLNARGMVAVEKAFAKFVGDKRAGLVIRRSSDSIGGARQSNILGMSKGTGRLIATASSAVASVVPVRGNTFMGDPE
ncbi:nucleotidyltransferase [Luteolibacter sp. Populi]|uniref:nucleotidyltransferase domain-containing protein n=1 Tax=Luteolibacter sp. Populi TaxID=3230487 RepID=UPI003465F760